MSTNENPDFLEIHSKNEEVNILNSCNKYAKYVTQEISITDNDYNVIKMCFEGSLLDCDKVKTYKIYRVTKNIKDATIGQKSTNMLLYHGTSLNRAVGILENGFEPSNNGSYGPGVYLTAGSSCAMSYAYQKMFSAGVNYNTLSFVFVNEILESDKMQKINIDKDGKWITNDSERANTINKKEFKKFIKVKSDEKKETYEEDSDGRKIRSSKQTEADVSNHFVCHEDLIIPRYLIQFFPLNKKYYPFQMNLNWKNKQKLPTSSSK